MKRFLLCYLIFLSVNVTGQEVDRQTVRKFALEFINKKSANRELISIDSIKNSKSELIGFWVDLKPQGYIITSSYYQIEPFICYSFNSKLSKSKIYNSFITADLEGRYNAIKSTNVKTVKDKWSSFFSKVKKSKASETIGPLIKTKWNQRSPYNDYCPMDPKLDKRSVVGCVATATTQILNYWKFPKSLILDDSDSYVSKGKNGFINIPEDNTKYSFPSFSSLNKALEYIDYSDDMDLGYLSFGVGVKQKMSYSASGSSSSTRSDIFRELGYGSASEHRWDDSVKEEVIKNIKKGWPVQVSIARDGGGHSVIFDGYKSDDSFHINMGWGGAEDSWYFPPNIDTESIDYDVVRNVVYNICPNQSWNQYCANAQNTRRTIFEIPQKNERKWSVTCDAGYKFNGIIVGSKSDIIASCSDKGSHPYIYFIDKTGVLESKVEIPETTDNLSIPVQNQNGDVFVISDDGKLFKVNQKTQKATFIYREPTGTEITWGLKIDKSGYVYVCGWDALYCLDPIAGKIVWEKVLPNGKYWYGIPAVDESKDLVLYQYYNGSSTQESTYVVLNRLTGNMVHSRNIYAKYSSKIGSASIDNNGIAYFGVHGDLYAYDLEDNNLNKIISTDGISKNTPTISVDGNIYTSYWKGDDYVLGSINPGDKTVRWEKLITDQDYDLVQEVYTDSRGVVCYTFHKENGYDPDTHGVHTLLDNGSYFEDLWGESYSVPSGKSFFGPDKTMYLNQGNKIIALSESDEDYDFPDYLNNSKPNKPELKFPSDNSIDLSNEITFSWSATDPDNNTLYYDIYVGSATNMLSLYEKGITKNSIKIGNFDPDSTYLWSVVASDGQSECQSEIWSFKMKSNNRSPNIPDLISPFNNISDLTTTPVLKWSGMDPDGDSPLLYSVLLDNGDGKGLVKIDETNATSYDFSNSNTKLMDGKLYLWAIIANDGELNSEQSEVWRFTTKKNDEVSPDVTFGYSGVNPTNNENIDLQITFTEEITGFDLSDLILSNCQAVRLESQDNINFSFRLNPLTDGELTVQLPANVVKDLAGNDNVESEEVTILYDGTEPTGEFIYSGSSRTNLDAFEIIITFNEEVTGFTLEDITASNCICSNLQTTDDIQYTLDVTPGDVGVMTLNLNEGMLFDLAGNGNSALDQLSIVVTGIELLQEYGIQIYPNPVKDYLIISSGGANEMISVQILNLVGNVIYTNQFKAPFTERINLSSWSNGIYFIRISAGSNSVTRKIILSK